MWPHGPRVVHSRRRRRRTSVRDRGSSRPARVRGRGYAGSSRATLARFVSRGDDIVLAARLRLALRGGRVRQTGLKSLATPAEGQDSEDLPTMRAQRHATLTSTLKAAAPIEQVAPNQVRATRDVLQSAGRVGRDPFPHVAGTRVFYQGRGRLSLVRMPAMRLRGALASLLLFGASSACEGGSPCDVATDEAARQTLVRLMARAGAPDSVVRAAATDQVIRSPNPIFRALCRGRPPRRCRTAASFSISGPPSRSTRSLVASRATSATG